RRRLRHRCRAVIQVRSLQFLIRNVRVHERLRLRSYQSVCVWFLCRFLAPSPCSSAPVAHHAQGGFAPIRATGTRLATPTTHHTCADEKVRRERKRTRCTFL